MRQPRQFKADEKLVQKRDDELSQKRLEMELAEKKRERKEFMRAVFFWSKVVFGSLALLGAAASLDSCRTVQEGHRGVKTRFGKVSSDETLKPGLNFKWPLIESIQQFDVRTKLIQGSERFLTSDSQPATIAYNYNYNVNPENVTELYQKVGMDYEKIVIIPAITDSIKGVIGQTKADDLVQKSDDVAKQIEENLKEKLTERGFATSSFRTPSPRFEKNFEDSIERKEIARQDSIRETHNTTKVKELAKQEEEKARGEANALKLRAEADAYAIRERAQAASSNPQALEFEIINKWDGKLPVVTGGASGNILDIKTVLQQATGKSIGGAVSNQPKERE